MMPPRNSLAPGGLAPMQPRNYVPGFSNMQAMQDPSTGQMQSNALQMDQVVPGAPQPMGVQGPSPMTHAAPPQPMMAPPGTSTPGYPNRQNRRSTPMGA